MKDGIFAIYMGNEYEAGLKDDGSFILRSQNSSDAANGFSLYKGQIHIKVVQRDDLKEVYDISTLAVYKGIIFRVIKEEKDQLLLCSMKGDYRVFESLGMDMVDKGVYHKWVSKNDVTALYEEKRPY